MVEKATFINAYKWTLIQKWLVRGLGLFSTLILVRLLSPEDFGIVALSSLVIGFFEVLGASGKIKYIIKKNNVSTADLNCAWTLNLLLRFTLTLVVFLSAPLFAAHLNEPKLILVLRCTCLILIIDSFKNIGLALELKAMNFKSTTQINVFSKLIAFIVTLSLAFHLKSYWALIIGTIVLKLCELAGSYILHSFRPKLSLTKITEQWSFSKWIFLTSISGFLRARLDILLLGANLGVKETGLYSVAEEFSVLPETEIIAPAMQPLYSVFSSMLNDHKKLENKVHQTIYLTYAFLIPCCIGISMLAEQITYVVLGEKWSEVVGLMQLLPFIMLNFLTYGLFLNISELMHKMKYTLLIDLLGSVIFILLIYTSVDLSVNDFAGYRITLAIILYITTLFCFNKVLNISIMPIIYALILPTVCGLIMLLGLYYVSDILKGNSFINLAINIVIGSVIYFGTYALALSLLKSQHTMFSFQYCLLSAIKSKLIQK